MVGLGIAAALHALLNSRSSQGAIAWCLFLVTMPLLALPLYLIFGQNKFRGYIDARRNDNKKLHAISSKLVSYSPAHTADFDPGQESYTAFEALTGMPLTKCNEVELLIDGQATFDAIFNAIDSATDYVLVQFFIIHDDELGRELQQHLIKKQKEGVPVYLMFDAMGSHSLSAAYLDEMTSVGIKVSAFRTTKGPANKLQLNFRNHRKIVVIDGHSAFVGGHNVGDEYMGRDKTFGAWRDTHVRVRGPAAICAQLSFIEDWFWATKDVPDLKWEPQVPENGNHRVMVIPSGPADTIETCNLLFVHAIHNAQKEIWISSPYFVPDEEVITALQLAALRGVDVRILLPAQADHMLVYLASFSYLDVLDLPGISFWRYDPGFLHQKVILSDQIAIVGTANADNRSFRLNFEISMLFADADFVSQVRRMLEEDFKNSHLTSADDYHKAPLYFKAGVKFARLLSPIL